MGHSIALSLKYYDRALQRCERFPREEVRAVIASCERKPRGDALRPALDAEKPIIESYLPLVVRLARGYSNEKIISFEDLIQEGNIGLIYAAQTWSPARGAKFSSWARLCIRGQLQRALMIASTAGAFMATSVRRDSCSSSGKFEGTSTAKQASDHRIKLSRIFPVWS